MVVMVGFPVWRWAIQRPSPTASWVHFKWVAPRGETMANFRKSRFSNRTVRKRSRTKIRTLRVRAAVANIASTRTRSAAGSSDSRRGISQTQERAHGRSAGDLEQTAIRTSCRKARVSTEIEETNPDEQKCLQDQHQQQVQQQWAARRSSRTSSGP